MRKNDIKLLAAPITLTVILIVSRYLFTGQWHYFFLGWNLFLAGLPLIFIYGVEQANSKGLTLLWTMLWLLFFPNAPYIITDLFHLRLIGVAPMWFDIALIFSTVWTGLLMGFLSLYRFENSISSTFKQTPLLTYPILFLSAFGIYLGRYLRWNSWDIIADPFSLLADVGIRLVKPLDHPRTWAMTVVFGTVLSVLYLGFKQLITYRLKPTPVSLNQ